MMSATETSAAAGRQYYGGIFCNEPDRTRLGQANDLVGIALRHDFHAGGGPRPSREQRCQQIIRACL